MMILTFSQLYYFSYKSIISADEMQRVLYILNKYSLSLYPFYNNTIINGADTVGKIWRRVNYRSQKTYIFYLYKLIRRILNEIHSP
jgi:hypothetical protein